MNSVLPLASDWDCSLSQMSLQSDSCRLEGLLPCDKTTHNVKLILRTNKSQIPKTKQNPNYTYSIPGRFHLPNNVSGKHQMSSVLLLASGWDCSLSQMSLQSDSCRLEGLLQCEAALRWGQCRA